MDIDKVDVATLFDKTQRYLVPLFQRSYVWSQVGQWQPLWEDIVAQVTHARGAGTRGPDRRHFLGALVLHQTPKLTRRIAAYEIIDGQQRLTTLQLFLGAFRDVVASENNPYLTETLTRLTTNPRATDDANEAFKVWPTNSDRDAFVAVLTAGSRGEVMKRFPTKKVGKRALPQPQLVEAYRFFFETIERYLTVESPSATGEAAQTAGMLDEAQAASTLDMARAEELLEVVERRLLFVEIELDAGEDPQVIFETLNARGEPLLASDLVRNFIFLKGRDSARKEERDLEALYKKWWLQFEEEAGPVKTKGDTGKFWKDQEKRGRIRRTRLDLFFFHYLACQTAEEIKIEHLFSEFREWWAAEDRSVSEVLRQLKALSEPFRGLLVPALDTPFGVFADRIRVLEQTTPYPLLLHLAEHKEELSPEEFAGILRDLESYLVRREVCRLTKKNYNHTFLQVLRNVRSAGRVSRASIQKHLLELTGESSNWPDDKAFQAAFITEPVYASLGPAKTQMMLAALDLELHTAKQERLHLDGALTVEHVRPQSPNAADWPTALQPSGTLTETDVAALRNRMIHSFGNLTLLTGPLNSSVSNGPFSAKRPAITANSRLLLNAYFQKFDEGSVWDEKSIATRAKEMFELAKRVWPRPSPAG